MTHIRPALPSDSPALAKVQVDSYRTAYRGIFPDSYLAQFSYEEQAQDWRNLFDTNPEDILLVAESTDGQIIGYLLARAQPDIHPGYDSEIVALHVLKSHQRQGTGRLLLKKAVELLQQRGCQSAMLWTLKANPIRRWYRNLGGKHIANKRFQVEDREIEEIAFGWDDIGKL